jgi:hypothetical protein
MFSFSPETKYESPNSLIPTGTIAFAMLAVRKIKNSNTTGGEYADLELTLVGQFEGRKVWPMVANPADQRNGEKWRQMGMAAIQHACEACGLFNPAQPESYNRFANATFIDVLTQLDGKRVAVKIGIEKGTDGHQDKNKVVDWISPNPNSAGKKAWDALVSGASSASQPVQQGGFMLNAAAPAAAPAPAAPAAVVSGSAPDWLN